MDSTDLQFLLDLVDRRIQRSTAMTAEYWRGYCQGIKEYFHHMAEESARDHHHEFIYKCQAEPYFEAYARGYCDGLKGRMS